MATGLGQDAGVFAPPPVEDVGYQDWASLTGMQPGHPLVGGTAGSPGYGGGQRQVAVADSSQAAMGQVAVGSPATQNWTQLFNLRGNPIGWVLIAALAYLALGHLHVRAGAGVKTS